MAEGVDYSAARPSGICLYSNGKRFAVRYFGPGGSWKHATAAECAGLWASGVDLVAVAEGAVGDPRSGFSMGQSHARSAHAAAVAAGMPSSRPIYFAIDFDQQPHEDAAVAAYLKGCRDIITHQRVGVYGGYRTVSWADAGGHATWFWQTYAWSGGRWWGGNHLEQYRNGVTVCGGDVDLCRSKTADYGQWHHSGQSMGQAPSSVASSTDVEPWEIADMVTALGRQFGDVAAEVDGATRYLRSM